jgi:hypothetical protein
MKRSIVAASNDSYANGAGNRAAEHQGDDFCTDCSHNHQLFKFLPIMSGGFSCSFYDRLYGAELLENSINLSKGKLIGDDKYISLGNTNKARQKGLII